MTKNIDKQDHRHSKDSNDTIINVKNYLLQNKLLHNKKGSNERIGLIIHKNNESQNVNQKFLRIKEEQNDFKQKFFIKKRNRTPIKKKNLTKKIVKTIKTGFKSENANMNKFKTQIIEFKKKTSFKFNSEMENSENTKETLESLNPLNHIEPFNQNNLFENALLNCFNPFNPYDKYYSEDSFSEIDSITSNPSSLFKSSKKNSENYDSITINENLNTQHSISTKIKIIKLRNQSIRSEKKIIIQTSEKLKDYDKYSIDSIIPRAINFNEIEIEKNNENIIQEGEEKLIISDENKFNVIEIENNFDVELNANMNKIVILTASSILFLIILLVLNCQTINHIIDISEFHFFVKSIWLLISIRIAKKISEYIRIQQENKIISQIKKYLSTSTGCKISISDLAFSIKKHLNSDEIDFRYSKVFQEFIDRLLLENDIEEYHNELKNELCFRFKFNN